MEDKPLESREKKEEPPQQATAHEHATDDTDGGDGQGQSPTQATQDGQLHPPENPTQAGATVVPSPLDASHPCALSAELSLISCAGRQPRRNLRNRLGI